MDEQFMKIALKQAQKALKHNEVPVGAIIVKDGKIISKAYNKKERKHDVTKHAEILVISKACKKLKNWRLEECILYTTMEPCMMCAGAIEQSRIAKVVYGAKNDNYGFSKNLNSVKIISQACDQECKKLIQLFFKKRR